MLQMCVITAMIVLISSTSFAEEKRYTVGIVPQFETKRLYKIWRPILDELERRTGLRFTLKGSTNIPDFENEFMSGSFDFAYMNPYHFIMASASEVYIPLVRDVGRSLNGVLVVRKDNAIQTVKELNHKKVAFPSPNAVGASLLMRRELTDDFSINVDPVYVQSHDSVYLNVAIGKVVAGGGVQATFNRQRPEIRDRLRIIHNTAVISPHPFAAHSTVPAEIREKVRNALLTIGESSDGKRMLSQVPIKQIGTASMADYAPLGDMKLNRFYISAN